MKGKQSGKAKTRVVKKRPTAQPILAVDKLGAHFGKIQLTTLMATSRAFPLTSRVDLQTALEKVFQEHYQAELVGVHPQYSHEQLTTAHLVAKANYPPLIGPLQHDEVDIGDVVPARCLRRGLWLGRHDGLSYSILLTQEHHFARGDVGLHLEVAVPPGDEGAKFSRDFLGRVEKFVMMAGSYKGKVISLEQIDNYSGRAGVIRVHKLRSVQRDEVVLPGKTLELLDRNVGEFIRQRERLQQLGMPVKKGLLFYGPPGTGKTHTIHYLASHLKDHTSLLITAEQVGLLSTYMQLARFLQP